MENHLVELCIDSACRSKDSVEKWRRQKRSLERLPSHLADALLRRLHARRLLYPSLLEYVSAFFFFFLVQNPNRECLCCTAESGLRAFWLSFRPLEARSPSSRWETSILDRNAWILYGFWFDLVSGVINLPFFASNWILSPLSLSLWCLCGGHPVAWYIVVELWLT